MRAGGKGTLSLQDATVSVGGRCVNTVELHLHFDVGPSILMLLSYINIYVQLCRNHYYRLVINNTNNNIHLKMLKSSKGWF